MAYQNSKGMKITRTNTTWCVSVPKEQMGEAICLDLSKLYNEWKTKHPEAGIPLLQEADPIDGLRAKGREKFEKKVLELEQRAYTGKINADYEPIPDPSFVLDTPCETASSTKEKTDPVLVLINVVQTIDNEYYVDYGYIKGDKIDKSFMYFT